MKSEERRNEEELAHHLQSTLVKLMLHHIGIDCYTISEFYTVISKLKNL